MKSPGQLLREYGLQAKKSWGQNFLVDPAAYSAILGAADLCPEDWAVEIGAGLGTLTARLAAACAHVIAIERDRDMVRVLSAELGADARVEIAEADALSYDYAAVAARAGRAPVVVGNLPYQIASPLLFRLIDARAKLAHFVCMLQLEMAERIVAAPATPEYGALSVMCQAYTRVRLVTRVRAGAFLPAPKVDSAVVRFDPLARADLGDEAGFSAVVHAAFQMRRKTLRNALRARYPVAHVDAALTALSIDGKRRGETLSVAEFAALSRELAGA